MTTERIVKTVNAAGRVTVSSAGPVATYNGGLPYTADGRLATSDDAVASGGTPAAPANSVQYNNAGAFGGNASFTVDPAIPRMMLVNGLVNVPMILGLQSTDGNANSRPEIRFYSGASLANYHQIYSNWNTTVGGIIAGDFVIACNPVGGFSNGSLVFVSTPANPNHGAIRFFTGGSAAANKRMEIDQTGNFILRPSVSATPQNNGDLTIAITANTPLTFKLKGTDGVVRTGTITLA